MQRAKGQVWFGQRLNINGTMYVYTQMEAIYVN
jgi:hypothetical protein